MAYLPLAGVKVLDLSRVLAGPFCTMMLGDLGADVIKIERPNHGDDSRAWGPPFDARGESAYYLSANRNKVSVVADLASRDDRDLVLDLMGDADVVVENFRPGVLERLGIRRGELQRQHDALIWCTITGFDAASARPGYDFVVQAEAGWMAITGEPDGSPMKIGIALADIVAGKDAVIAILAALAARGSRRGRSRHLVISLLDSARATLVNVAQNTMVSGADARRWGNAHANLVPYQLFQASDRPLVIAVGTDAQWIACAHALELHDLAGESALATNAGRLAQRNRIVEAFDRVLAQRTAAEWAQRLDAVGVPCGVVRTVLEAVADAAGASSLTGMPSSVGGVVRLPPPRLNEHGALVRQQKWSAFQRLR
ncbi:MAG TPA: CoA transferase [Gemmatimonadaceae bacterium]|nr:CoA transferase [Gemmatimonadaceae bacterium]